MRCSRWPQGSASCLLLSNSNQQGAAILVSFADEGRRSSTTNGPINITSGDTSSIEAK